MAEQEKKQKESKRAERGAWATYNPQDHSKVAATGSEIAAYRLGNPRGWQVVPWPFGLTLDEAIAKATSAPSGNVLGSGIKRTDPALAS